MWKSIAALHCAKNLVAILVRKNACILITPQCPYVDSVNKEV